MKKIILTSLYLLLFCSLALAVPQYVNYQGVLKNSSGDLQDGTFSMVFQIYDASSGGTAVYNAAGTSTNVTVTNGIYSVKLGPLDSGDFNGDDRWLQVTVAGDTLSPRLEINSVGYAILAGTATNADYSTLSGTATSAGTADYALLAGTATTAASATTASTADYAPLSGTATSAGTADYALLSGTATTAASATTATTADYAPLSGTASNATTVNNINASDTPAASQLYPLDASTRLSGVAITAEASSGFALFVDGRLGGQDAGSGGGSAPGTAGIVGKATLSTGVGAGSVTVYNPNVKTTSSIFITPYDNDANSSANGLRVQEITSDGQFTVTTWTGALPSDNDVDFVYLIIN